MRNQSGKPKCAVVFLSVAILGFAIQGWASQQSQKSADVSSPAENGTQARAGKMAPLEIAREGYVFAGGKYSTAKDVKVMSGQIYAEFQIPLHQRHPYPVVFIHGGSQTGTNFTGTPDGREGWAQYFVRRGYAVYVVDQVARGRAAHWSLSQGPVQPAALERIEQRFVIPEQYKQWPQAHLHTQWPGDGKPGDATFEQFYASQFPSINDFAKQQQITPPAIIALLEKIGPSI